MRNATKNIRVLIVDDHVLVREAICKLIESWSGLTVAAEAGNRAEALALTAREKPDIILLELNLGRSGSGLDWLHDILSTSGNGRIIVVTAVQDPEVHHTAIRLGASGLVLKEQSSKELHKAILKVHAGEVWLDRKLTASFINRISLGETDKKHNGEAERIASLSRREREVAVLVGEGLKNKDFACRLYISETTVHHHLTSVYSKLQVANRFDLFILVHRHESGKIAPLTPSAFHAGVSR